MVEKLIQGALLSFGLASASLMLGFCLALCFTYLLNTHKAYFKIPIQGFITITGGVPLLVQIYLLYYGPAQFEWVRSSIIWEVFQHPFLCATLALALNSSAYTTVLLQSFIQAIPKGEIEAAKVLNLSFFDQMRKIIFPRVFTQCWPAYSNEAIMILKSTSLASVITLMDLMGAMRYVISETYQTAPALVLTSLLYLGMAALSVGVFSYLKRCSHNK